LPHSKGALELISMAGRRDERKALLAALRSRQSRLIVGPPGIGKTRLLQECVTDEFVAPSGCGVLRVETPSALHHLLLSLAQQLDCRSARYPNLREAPSLHLKPLVWDAIRAHPQCVILENLAHGDPRMYRFLQELYYIPDASLMVTVRSSQSIGHVRKLFWDPRETIVMKPLTHLESLRLFDEASRAFDLDSFGLDDFRQKVIDAARGNPGQIIAMCRLAKDPQYRSGRYIKFLPLRMDVLSAFVP